MTTPYAKRGLVNPLEIGNAPSLNIFKGATSNKNAERYLRQAKAEQLLELLTKGIGLERYERQTMMAKRQPHSKPRDSVHIRSGTNRNVPA